METSPGKKSKATDDRPLTNTENGGKGEKEMTREQGATPQALAAVRAGKNLLQWGDYATTRFLRKNEVPFRMFAEVLRVEELLAARKPTIRDIAIEALEWLQHKGPVGPRVGICSNLGQIVSLRYPDRHRVAGRLYSVVSGLCAGWRGLDDLSSFPITVALLQNPELQAQADKEELGAWEGVRGQLRRELVAHLLMRLKAGHMTYYTSWLDDSANEKE